MSKPNDDWKPISISLPARYWITVLGLTENFVQQKVTPQIEDLRKRGSKLDDVPDEMKAILMGPVFARGVIIDALCEAGIMKPEVKAKMGTDKLMEMAKKYYDQNRKSNGSH
jgi:hypothetical protein